MNPSWIRLVPAVLAGVMGTACSAQARDDQRYTTRDSVGVQIVESAAAAETLTAPRVLSIGSVDGAVLLYQVRHVHLAPDGSLIIAESSSGLLRQFDERGAVIREMGGAGQGPGEFRGLWWTAVLPGDTVVAFDLAYPGSLSYFDPQGVFVRSFQVPRVGLGEFIVVGALGDGQVVVRRQGSDPDLPEGSIVEHRIYGVTSDGEVGTDLGDWPTGAVLENAYAVYRPEASFGAINNAFLYAPGGPSEVRIFDPTSMGLRRISRVDRRPTQITQSDIDTYMAEVWEPRVASAAGTPLEQGIRELGPPVFADVLPAYVALLPNNDGGFWANRGVLHGDTTNLWDVFDSDGVYVGSVTLPSSFRPMSLVGDRVAGVWLDEYDVEFVHVYGLEG